MLVVLGLVVFALVVVPLLLFGVELIIVGCVLAASLFVLGRPWLVQARTVSGSSHARLLEWRISGWQRSGTHIQQVASELAAGHDHGLARTVVSCGLIWAPTTGARQDGSASAVPIRGLR